jgi:hypothetical protein
MSPEETEFVAYFPIYLTRMVKEVPKMTEEDRRRFMTELTAIPKPTWVDAIVLAFKHSSRQRRIVLISAAIAVVETISGRSLPSALPTIHSYGNRVIEIAVQYIDNSNYLALLGTSLGAGLSALGLYAGVPPNILSPLGAPLAALFAPGQSDMERLMRAAAPTIKSAVGTKTGTDRAIRGFTASFGLLKIVLESLIIGGIVREGIFLIAKGLTQAGSNLVGNSSQYEGLGDFFLRYSQDVLGDDGAYDDTVFPLTGDDDVALVNTDQNVTDAISAYLADRVQESRSFNGQGRFYGVYDNANTMGLARVITVGSQETVSNRSKTLNNSTDAKAKIGELFRQGLAERFPKQSIISALLSVNQLPSNFDSRGGTWKFVPRKDTFKYLVERYTFGGSSIEASSRPLDAEPEFNTLDDVILQDDHRGNGYFVYNETFLGSFPNGFENQNILQSVYFMTTNPQDRGIEAAGGFKSLGGLVENILKNPQARLFTARPGVVKIGDLTITTSNGGVVVKDEHLGAAYIKTYLDDRAPRVPGGAISPQTRFNKETTWWVRSIFALAEGFFVYKFGLALAYRPQPQGCEVYVAEGPKDVFVTRTIICDQQMATAYNEIFKARDSLDISIAGHQAALIVISQVAPQIFESGGSTQMRSKGLPQLRRILDVNYEEGAQLVAGTDECIFRQMIAWKTADPRLIALAYEQTRNRTEAEEMQRPRPCAFAGKGYCAENRLDTVVRPNDVGKGVSAFCQSGGIWYPYTDAMTATAQETQFCHTACLVKFIKAQLEVDISAQAGAIGFANTMLRIIVGVDRQERILEEPYVHFFSQVVQDADSFAAKFQAHVEGMDESSDEEYEDYWENLIKAFIAKRRAYIFMATGGIEY